MREGCLLYMYMENDMNKRRLFHFPKTKGNLLLTGHLQHKNIYTLHITTVLLEKQAKTGIGSILKIIAAATSKLKSGTKVHES